MTEIYDIFAKNQQETLQRNNINYIYFIYS